MKLEKDPQGRAANPNLDKSDLEKFFRDHVKSLQEVNLDFPLILYLPLDFLGSVYLRM